MASMRQQVAESAAKSDLSLRLSLYPKQLFIGNVELKLAEERTLDFYSNKSKRMTMCFSLAPNPKMGISPKDISIALTKFEALSTKRGDAEYTPPAVVAHLSPNAAHHLIRECGSTQSQLAMQNPPNSHLSEVAALLTIIFREDTSKENARKKTIGLDDDVFMRAYIGCVPHRKEFEFDADDAFDIIEQDILKMWNACLTDRWKRRSVVHDNKTSSLITPLKVFEWESFIFSLHLHMKMIDHEFRYVYFAHDKKVAQRARVITLEKIDQTKNGKRPLTGNFSAPGHDQCCGSIRLDYASNDTKCSIRCRNERVVVIVASSQFLDKQNNQSSNINSLNCTRKRKSVGIEGKLEEKRRNTIDDPNIVMNCEKEKNGTLDDPNLNNSIDSAAELSNCVQKMNMNEAGDCAHFDETNAKKEIEEEAEPMDISIETDDRNDCGDNLEMNMRNETSLSNDENLDGTRNDEELQKDEKMEEVLTAQETFMRSLEELNTEWNEKDTNITDYFEDNHIDEPPVPQVPQPTPSHPMVMGQNHDYASNESSSGSFPHPYGVPSQSGSNLYYHNQTMFYSPPFANSVDTSEIDHFFVKNKFPVRVLQDENNSKRPRNEGPLQKAVFNGQKAQPANQKIASTAQEGQLNKKGTEKQHVETLIEDDNEVPSAANLSIGDTTAEKSPTEEEDDVAMRYDEKLFVYPPKNVNTDLEPTTVTVKDALTLAPSEFLNDSILHFKMVHTQCHMDPELHARCFFFNTFFYSGLVKQLPTTSTGKKDFVMTKNTLKQLGLNSERIVKWTKKFDLFLKDYVVIPINEDLHWLLIIVVNPHGAIVEKENEEESRKKPKTYLLFFDPLNGLDPNRNLYMSFYLQKYFMTLYNKTKTPTGKFPTATETFFDPTRIETVVPKNLPIQRNYLDCGAFVLYFIDTFFMDRKPVTAEEVPNFDWEERYEMSRDRADLMRQKVYNMVSTRMSSKTRSRFEKFERRLKRNGNHDADRARRHHSSGLPRKSKRNTNYHARSYSLDPPASGVMDKTICGNPRLLMEMECTHKVRQFAPLGDRCMEYLKE